MKPPLLDRLAKNIAFPPDPDGCWESTLVPDREGYARIGVDGNSRNTHRVIYELLVGPIPPGMQIDHLCRNRLCVNPDHLEPVTPRENLARSKNPAAVAVRTGFCFRGHSMDEAYVRPDGFRQCRTCKRDTMRRIRANGR